jgi:hypothetical protein
VEQVKRFKKIFAGFRNDEGSKDKEFIEPLITNFRILLVLNGQMLLVLQSSHFRLDVVV